MTQSIADFRSDTITKPTKAMLDAMLHAELGDDVLGDDPTVHKLEKLAAEKLGKQAAVFVPSGTMGNQASIAAQTKAGDEIIIEEAAHCFHFEAGGLARIAAVQAKTIPGKSGLMPLTAIEAAIRPQSVHMPRTALIALEQTHMNSGGCVLPLGYMKDVYTLAKKHQLRVHLDGARLFNACVAAKIEPRVYGACADSITFCLSKGLSAPAGSMICGEQAFIDEVRRIRKFLGGGMRQTGLLAACGLVALETMIERLAEDHARAKELAVGLTSLPGCKVDHEVATNLVILSLDPSVVSALELQNQLERNGVRAIALSAARIRFVTHRHINSQEVVKAIQAVEKIIKGKG